MPCGGSTASLPDSAILPYVIGLANHGLQALGGFGLRQAFRSTLTSDTPRPGRRCEPAVVLIGLGAAAQRVASTHAANHALSPHSHFSTVAVARHCQAVP